MTEYFKYQIDSLPTITDDVLSKIEFKRVWSGKMLQEDDQLLTAYVYKPGTDDLKAITFVPRELDEVGTQFNFIRMENDVIPVLAFKNDTKQHQ